MSWSSPNLPPTPDHLYEEFKRRRREGRIKRGAWTQAEERWLVAAVDAGVKRSVISALTMRPASSIASRVALARVKYNIKKPPGFWG